MGALRSAYSYSRETEGKRLLEVIYTWRIINVKIHLEGMGASVWTGFNWHRIVS
jgi:hypothetical protein